MILALPIPNDNTRKGLTFAAQFGVIDANSKRASPLIAANGLECTIH